MSTHMPPHDTSRTVPAESADWRQHSACRTEDPDLWFPSISADDYGRDADQAKAICARCPVLNECLSYAQDSRQRVGVWGGLDPLERRLLRGAKPRRNQRDGTVVDDLVTRRRAELDAVLAQRLTSADTAERLGTNVKTVREVMRRLGMDFSPLTQPVDQERIGRFVSGEWVKLSDGEFIEAMRRFAEAGVKNRQVDEMHGRPVGETRNRVSKLRERARRDGWEFPEFPALRWRRFSEAQVVAIRERAAEGETDLALALAFDTARSTVQDIRLGRQYTDFGGPVQGPRRGYREESKAVFLESGERGSQRRGVDPTLADQSLAA